MYDENSNLGVYSGYEQNQPNDRNREPSGPAKKPEQKKRGFFKKAMASVAFGLLFGISAGVSFYAIKGVADYVSPGKEKTEEAQEVIGEAENAADSIAQNVDQSALGADTPQMITTVMDVTSVVHQVMPSVVSITNSYVVEENYFGRPVQSEGEVSGSGIIIGENDDEFLIATNYHVIEDADSLTVQFIDDEQVEANVKGTESSMDLAVIAVSRSEMKQSTLDAISIAQMGDSDSLEVGEPAIAIGNSLGYGQSVTTGVISAVDREIEMENITGTFIQTDAAINPGNSGGALLNLEGRVIGINSNKIGGTVVEGMGYAIPISSAEPILENLMTKTTRVKVDESQKGFIGITGVNVTADVAEAYNMPQGVYVSQVYEGTAAAEGGIVKGNIITEFDGNKVTGMEDLQKTLNYYAAGSSVELTVMEGSPNGYTEKKVTIVLGAQGTQQQVEQ